MVHTQSAAERALLAQEKQAAYGSDIDIGVFADDDTNPPLIPDPAQLPAGQKKIWQAVAPDADKYTARVALHQEHGYFIRALPGVKVAHPVQACLYIGTDGVIQDVHNLIVFRCIPQ